MTPSTPVELAFELCQINNLCAEALRRTCALEVASDDPEVIAFFDALTENLTIVCGNFAALVEEEN